ncbi:MAG: 1-deoxy-D-xylulose-5-phosphate reductoisomerase, partial [Deltaproteobacteria bacterium]|nr:1-deoxy-D-xylulose-5-phosphate reductoisomerase [Deltaproteobacteria bacterium]
MSGPIKISVLGATGSIGRSTLSLAKAFEDRLEVVGLAAKTSVEALAWQTRLFRPKVVSVEGEEHRKKLLGLLKELSVSPLPEVLIGPDGLVATAVQSGAQAVISAVVGACGLRPAWIALEKGLKVALANKESLVLGGELIMKKVGSNLTPVDSEHSAIFQALGGKLRRPELRRIILTASGGPFRGWSSGQLQKVTRRMALNHPTWSMGPKISCDSATMMNKGLEVIEAHHLFGLDYDRIEVVVHSASLVH